MKTTGIGERSLVFILDEMARIVWRQRTLVIIAFCICITVSMLAIRSITPKFEASSLLAVGDTANGTTSDIVRKSTAASLAKIALSNEVLVAAVEAVGPERLVRDRSTWISELWRRHYPFSSPVISTLDAPESQSKEVVQAVGKSLVARVDASSDLIIVSYRHEDPAVAADFVNGVSAALINRQLSFSARPGAAKFYERQAERFRDEIKFNADKLQQFMIQTETYSVEEQNQLLLKRASDLSSALLTTRSLRAEKEGQREALSEQLRKLRPVTQSPFVSSLVEELGAPALRVRPQASKDDAPPLLMVKVYQDAIVALFKVNADLQGLAKLEAEQVRQSEIVNAELTNLAKRSSEFSQLRRAVSQAEVNADIFARRTVDEQINLELSTAKISPLRVAQAAFTPISHVSPSYLLLSAFACFMSAVVSIALPIGLELFAKWRNSPNADVDYAHAANVHETQLQKSQFRPFETGGRSRYLG